MEATIGKASVQRQETASRMQGELEKRLFESERDRVVLRRERETLERQAAAAQAELERGGLSQ